ncbi:hypothetical protein D869_gp175 [Caulobacter phage CcrRogue]|uniref:Uncharacterized protein n=1 Tax=Caulobacter phage CcrRogue TaxID=2927986 RepID=K4JND3_9CAUD|nr:hypothetical protein D869_gp175 [Caulobacter phage CcrRogue]AFU86739.1 hypothetical protein CcrRogue_gp257 [Caulobacter phage CcrRogue]
MGSYTYCPNRTCGAGLGPPSIREVVENERKCPHCGGDVPVYDSLADVLERMEGKIEELQEEVRVLREGDDLGS